MYELLATAAAGILAGSDLHAAVAGVPGASSRSNDRYHHRTRVLSLLLASTSCGCASAAYLQVGSCFAWRSVDAALLSYPCSCSRLATASIQSPSHRRTWELMDGGSRGRSALTALPAALDDPSFPCHRPRPPIRHWHRCPGPPRCCRGCSYSSSKARVLLPGHHSPFRRRRLLLAGAGRCR